MLEHALNYAAMGLRVIPLHSPRNGACSCGRSTCEKPGKHPRPIHGVKEASTDEKVIRQWWRVWPDANIGVATGSGLAVVDFDRLEDPAWSHEVRSLLNEKTRTVRTSRGRHVWLMTDSPVRSKTYWPGVDIKSDGGYVIVPPSKHVSGISYEWESEPDADIARMPDVVADAVAAVGGENASVEPFDFENVEEGGRNVAAFRYVSKLLARGWEPSRVWDALQGWNLNNRPPMGKQELRNTFASACRTDSTNHPDRDSERAAIEARGQMVERVTDADGALHVVPIGSMSTEEPEFVVEDILNVEETGVLFGQPGTYKTFVALDLSLRIAHGLTWHGKDLLPGNVLYLCGEGKGGFSGRFQAWNMGNPHARDKKIGEVYVADLLPLLDIKSQLDKALSIRPYVLCVVDTMSVAMGSLDENAAGEVNKLLNVMRELRGKHRTAFLMIHHAAKGGKGPQESINAIRGSSATSGNIEAVLHLTRKSTDKEHVDLYVAKVKDAESQYSIGMRFNAVELGVKRNGKPRASGFISHETVGEHVHQWLAEVVRTKGLQGEWTKREVEATKVDGVSRDASRVMLRDSLKAGFLRSEVRPGHGGGEVYRLTAKGADIVCPLLELEPRGDVREVPAKFREVPEAE